MAVLSCDMNCPSCYQYCEPRVIRMGSSNGLLNYLCPHCGNFTITRNLAKRMFADETGMLRRKIHIKLEAWYASPNTRRWSRSISPLFTRIE